MNLKTMKLGIFCACAALISTAQAVYAETIRIASEGTFPPFEYLDSKTGKLEGFEVELALAMCKEAGFEPEVTMYKFDGILPAVVTGAVDMAASGLAMTPERAKKVLFVDPFYVSGITIIVPKGNPAGIKSFEDLKGKRISVQIGSISYDRAKTIPDAQVTTFDNASDAMLNMLGGNADAVINSAAATDYMLVIRPGLGKKVERLPVTEGKSKMAMIVGKDKPEIQKRLNAALAAIKANGTYNKIHEKWFGKPADLKALEE